LAIEFKNLRTDKCPICEAPAVEEGLKTDVFYVNKPRVRQHNNGQRWEFRRFLCGLKVEWNPNWREESFIGNCSNDKDIEKIINKRRAFLDALTNTAKENIKNVDKAFYDYLFRGLEDGRYRQLSPNAVTAMKINPNGRTLERLMEKDDAPVRRTGMDIS